MMEGADTQREVEKGMWETGVRNLPWQSQREDALPTHAPSTSPWLLCNSNTHLLCSCQCRHQPDQSRATAQLKHLLALEYLWV